MRSKAEQIAELLGGNTVNWAVSQFPADPKLADHQYSDFISVTPDEVVAHVLEHGFDVRAVWTPGHPRPERDDRLVVEPKGAEWACFYTERGSRSRERTYPDKEGAVRDAVMRLLDRAWTSLNSAYWHHHFPKLEQMPDFGEPWVARTTEPGVG
jgi:hypothetical protein